MRMAWLCRCGITFFLGVVTIQITNSSLLWRSYPRVCVFVVGLELSAQSHRFMAVLVEVRVCMCARVLAFPPRKYEHSLEWIFMPHECYMAFAPRVRLHPSSKRLQLDLHAFQLHSLTQSLSVRFASIRLCVCVRVDIGSYRQRN